MNRSFVLDQRLGFNPLGFPEKLFLDTEIEVFLRHSSLKLFLLISMLLFLLVKFD